MILLENCFNVIWGESLLGVCMREEWYTNNLQVGFGFRKTRFVYLERIDVIQALDIIVDDSYVQLL